MAIDLEGWRWRNDDGDESTATFRAAANTSITITNLDETLRCRTWCQTNALSNPTWGAKFRVNGGAFEFITDTSSPLRYKLSANVTDAVGTTQQISSGSFLSGTVQEADADGPFGGNPTTFTSGSNTEHELVLGLDPNYAFSNNTIEIDIGNGGESDTQANGYATLVVQLGDVVVCDGPNYAGNVANAGNDADTWTDPGNASGDTSGTSATRSFTASGGTQQSDDLECTQFALDVAPGRLSGITVEVDWAVTIAGTITSPTASLILQLHQNGTAIGDVRKIGTTAASASGFISSGNSGDPWGVDLGDSEIEASTFGVWVKAQAEDIGGTGDFDFQVKRVRMTVCVIEDEPASGQVAPQVFGGWPIIAPDMVAAY